MSVVMVAGSSGLVGRALVHALELRGDKVRRLVRSLPRSSDEFLWDPASGQIPSEALEGVDAVVNLCGTGIADGRWTAKRKRSILSSRVDATRLLAESCAPSRVGVLVNASAIGFYGDRDEAWLTESSAPGGGFLADTCVSWEAAACPAEESGTRVVRTRFGLVVSPSGGAVERMAMAYRWGLGGPLGSGRQWVSWIHLEDVVGGILHVLDETSVRGPVLFTSASPVRQTEFAKALGRALHRPAVLPLPGRILSLLLGDMGRELLLFSQRCRPEVLMRSGYRFRHPDLDGALQEFAGRGRGRD